MRSWSSCAAKALLLLLCVQCSRTEPAGGPDSPREEKPRTVATKFTVKGPIRACELFVYRCDALGTLAAHWAWTPDSTPGNTEGIQPAVAGVLKLEEGCYRAVAICNACAPVNLLAVQRREAFDRFTYNFADEDPATPLLSAAADFKAGEELVLEPVRLLGRVHLVSVQRQFEGVLEKAVVEQPRVFLKNVPAKAEVLREKDFHPAEFFNPTPLPPTVCRALASSLGYSELRPGIELYCYPNDTGGTDIAAPHTKIVLEGRIDGTYRRWEADLGPLGRNCNVHAEFVLYNETDCRFWVY